MEKKNNTKETLEKQLQLLSERSTQVASDQLPEITQAICKVAELLFSVGR